MMEQKTRELVIPGELLDDSGRLRAGSNTYKEKGGVYAARLGLKEVRGDTVSVIGLSGRYDPQRGDMVIGTVVEVGPSNWYITIGAAGDVGMHVNDVPWRVEFGETSKYLKAGDTVLLKINHVDELKKAQVSMKDRQARKLSGGVLFDVTPTKVPRIIGRNGSMITMVKNLTNTRMFVGQNGVIWIDGEAKDVQLATDAIRKIEEEAHLSGLTDKIRDWLKSMGATGREDVGVDDERAYGMRHDDREETPEGEAAAGAEPRAGGFRDGEPSGEGERREGGFRERREGGFREGGRERREGGFRERREGGFRERREGGFRERRDGGEEGGSRERREGGFRERREGGEEGGSGGRREGGFRERREGGEEGGFRERRPRDADEAPRGGFRERREEGAREERGGFRDRGEAAEGRSRGGFRDREPRGGFREGGSREGGPREGGFREGGSREGGFREREGGFRERAERTTREPEEETPTQTWEPATSEPADTEDDGEGADAPAGSEGEGVRTERGPRRDDGSEGRGGARHRRRRGGRGRGGRSRGE